jgi:PAS domain S-box-containing protein
MKIRARNPLPSRVELATPVWLPVATPASAGLEFLPLPVVVLDQSGLIRDCNSAALRLFGRERSHLDRLPFAVLVKQGDINAFVRHLQLAKERPNETIESELCVRGRERHAIPVQLVTRAAFATSGLVFQTALVDLTERKAREQQLEEVRQYTELFEFVPEPLLVIDLDLNIVSTNAAFRERLRCTRAEVEGLALDQINLFRWNTPELFPALQKVAAGGAVMHNFPCEVVLVGLGERLFFLVNARKPAREEGKRPVVLVAMQDVTRQRGVEFQHEQLVEDLRHLNMQLETRVHERTAELRDANKVLSALSRRLVGAQETERRRIAETLHDDIGQLLTALNLVLKRARRASSITELSEAELLVVDLLERVRRLAMNLRPHVLDNLGLAVALRWHAKNFSEHAGIPVQLHLRGIPRNLRVELAVTAFRFVQEALTNVARHSHAKCASVSVIQLDGFLEIEVRDNGRGFDPDHVPNTCSGIANLRERICLSGGEFSITSAPHRGTTMRGMLPCATDAPAPDAQQK